MGGIGSDRLRRRKLLVATVGVAAVSYVVGTACNNSATSGNLMAPPDEDAQVPPTSGNLPAPPPPTDAGDSGEDAGDSGEDASDAGDSGEDASDGSSG